MTLLPLLCGELLCCLVLSASPPQLLSDPTEEASTPNVEASGLVSWDAMTPQGQAVRHLRLGKKIKNLRAPKGDAPMRGLGWIKDGKKPLVHVLHEGRWSLQVGGEEPASPSAASDLMGAMSPDRQWVAFVSGRSGKGDLYVTRADKTNQPPKRVATSALPDLAPVWSPNGDSLAFLRITEKGRVLVILSGLKGGAELQERIAADERAGVLSHSFSPDGEQLAFIGRDWNVGTALYTVNPKMGGANKVLVDVMPTDIGPAWVKSGDSYSMIVVRKDRVVAVDASGGQKVLETGTFGHGAVVAATVAGQRTLILTAMGVSGDEDADLRKRKVYRWIWEKTSPAASPQREPASTLPPL